MDQWENRPDIREIRCSDIERVWLRDKVYLKGAIEEAVFNVMTRTAAITSSFCQAKPLRGRATNVTRQQRI